LNFSQYRLGFDSKELKDSGAERNNENRKSQCDVPIKIVLLEHSRTFKKQTRL
jgi:hypothetical protein